jgi:hypothetical protein
LKPFVAQACGEELLPLGEATGGHGLPGVGIVPGALGEVPPELPVLLPLPAVDGFDPEFGTEPDDPFPDDPLDVPGRVPHGEPLGELPGLVGVFGVMVDG